MKASLVTLLLVSSPYLFAEPAKLPNLLGNVGSAQVLIGNNLHQPDLAQDVNVEGAGVSPAGLGQKVTSQIELHAGSNKGHFTAGFALLSVTILTGDHVVPKEAEERSNGHASKGVESGNDGFSHDEPLPRVHLAGLSFLAGMIAALAVAVAMEASGRAWFRIFSR